MDQETKQHGWKAIKCFFLFKDQRLSTFLWVLGMYVVLVPSITLIPSVGNFNEKRALQIGLLIIVGITFVSSQRWRQHWLSTFRRVPSAARWMLGVVLGLGLLSSALAPAPYYALLEVGHYFLLFILAGAVATFVHRAQQRYGKILLGFVAVSALLYAVYFSVGYVKSVTAPNLSLWPDGRTNFANTRIFNQYQTLTLPLLAGAVLALPKQWRVAKGGLFGLVALWWALIFASNVRGTILALIVAAVGVAFLFWSRAKKWVLLQVLGLLVGLGLYYLLFSSGAGPPIVDKVADANEYSRRLQHWQTCLEMAWAHPLLGAGPMHFAWPPNHYAIAASPHNAFMQWLAEWGIPSTAIMSGLTVWGGWAWFRQEQDLAEGASTTSNGVRVGLVAAVLAGAAHSMVSGLILAPLSQMLLVLVGGWAWGRYRFRQNNSDVAFSFRAHALLCGLLIGAVVIVGSSFRDLSSATDRQVAFMNSVERNRLSPRYWTQGYIGVRDSSVIERAQRDR